MPSTTILLAPPISAARPLSAHGCRRRSAAGAVNHSRPSSAIGRARCSEVKPIAAATCGEELAVPCHAHPGLAAAERASTDVDAECPEAHAWDSHQDMKPSSRPPSGKSSALRQSRLLASRSGVQTQWCRDWAAKGVEIFLNDTHSTQVSAPSKAFQKSSSRPPSAASAMSQHPRNTSSRGSTHSSRRGVPGGLEIIGSDAHVLQVWDMTCDNQPSYMRQTRNSQINRGHSLAAFYNLKYEREKHAQLCGGHGRRSVSASRRRKPQQSTGDLEVISVDEGVDGDSPETEAAFASVTERATVQLCSDMPEGTDLLAQEAIYSESSMPFGMLSGAQEETATTKLEHQPSASSPTALEHQPSVPWNLQPSVASWLLRVTPIQRRALDRKCMSSEASYGETKLDELPATFAAGPKLEKASQCTTARSPAWHMRPSVGTWMSIRLSNNSKQDPMRLQKELRKVSDNAPEVFTPFTSLTLSPLPSWFCLPPRPPSRTRNSRTLCPPPFTTCAKYVAVKESTCSRRAYKDKLRFALSRHATKSSSSPCRRNHSRRTPVSSPTRVRSTPVSSPTRVRRTPVSSPTRRKAMPTHDAPSAGNMQNLVLFDSWRANPDAVNQARAEGFRAEWHDVAVTMVARQQAPSLPPAVFSRPSVGTWLRRPMPGPAQIQAFEKMSGPVPVANVKTVGHEAQKPGCLALHIAARDGNTAAVQMLLAVHAEPGATDSRGISPLHLAAEAGRDDITRLLLDASASPHASTLDGGRSEHGITPLHAAACCGSINVAMRLLTAGASPAQARGDGVLPLHFAAQGGHVNVTLVLIAAGSPIDHSGAGGFAPLHDSAHGGHLNVVAALLAGRADPDVITDGGTTPLHAAAQRGHTDITKRLLAHGASHSIDSVGGFTPLHDAAHAGHKAIVRQLIRAKASSNARSTEGATPLHLAAQAGWTSVAALLVKACAASADDMHTQSPKSVASPRRLAASRGHVSVIRALRSRRAAQRLGTL